MAQRDRGFVVGVVAIHYEDAGQGRLAEHLGSNGARTALAKAKEAELRRGEEPGITVASVSAPTGLVGVFDRGLAILCEHLFDCRVQQARPMLLA